MSISHFRDREKPSVLTASDQNRRFFASRTPRAGHSAGARPKRPRRGTSSRAKGTSSRAKVVVPETEGAAPERGARAKAVVPRARSERRRGGGHNSRAMPIRRSGGHSAGARPQSVAGGVTDCGRRSRVAPPPSNAIGPRRLPGPDLLHAALSYAMMLACLLVCLLARWSPTYLTSWIFSMSSRVVSR